MPDANLYAQIVVGDTMVNFKDSIVPLFDEMLTDATVSADEKQILARLRSQIIIVFGL